MPLITSKHSANAKMQLQSRSTNCHKLCIIQDVHSYEKPQGQMLRGNIISESSHGLHIVHLRLLVPEIKTQSIFHVRLLPTVSQAFRQVSMKKDKYDVSS
jgi:hypothetical protein